MRRAISLLLASLLCATGSAWSVPAASAAGTSDVALTLPSYAPVGETRTIYGSLTQDGVGLPDATLEITDTPSSETAPRTRTITTNAAGAISFDYTSRSDRDTIVVHYAGDATHATVTESFYLYSASRDLQLDLEGPTSVAPLSPIMLTGTLTSEGTPVPDIPVNIVDVCGSGTYDRTVTTDDQGTFTFTDTPPRRCQSAYYLFDVTHSASEVYEPASASRTVWVDWTPSRIFLEPQSQSVRVGGTATWTGGVSVDGVPTAGQTVEVTVNGQGGPVDTATLTTDDTGHFSYSRQFDRAAGYSVEFWYDGTDTVFRDDRTATLAVRRTATGVSFDQPDVAVRGGSTVELGGVAIDEDGEPLADRQLAVTVNGASRTPVRTDSEGRFLVSYVASTPDVPPWEGNDVVRVSLPQDDAVDAAEATARVAIRRAVTHVFVDVGPDASTPGQPVSISGKLVELVSGSGVPDAPLVVSVRGGAYYETKVVDTQADGTFSLPASPSGGGRYDVTVAYLGDATHHPSSTDAAWEGPGVPGVLRLSDVPPLLVGESALLRGRITDEDGVPDPTLVDFTAVQENGDRIFLGTSTADDDGRFRYRYLARQPERVSVIATTRTWLTTSQSESVVVDVHALGLESRAVAPEALRNGWAVYAQGSSPKISTTTFPAREDLCLRYSVQKFRGGAWQGLDRSRCRVTNESGRSTFTYTGRTKADLRLRIRPVWESRVPAAGEWVKVRFYRP